MIARYQPPAYSPLSPAALASGLRTALATGDSQRWLLARIRDEYSARTIVLTSTGTAALSLAIRSVLADRPGRVALPAYSCFDVSSAAESVGADVVLYDLDPRTLTPDSSSLQRALENGATAVVVAHLYGLPIDVAAVSTAAMTAGAVVIEDSAQAFGAKLRGVPAGSLAPLSVLSFARGKGVTGGGGGALLAMESAPDRILSDLAGTRLAATGGWGELVRAASVWALARPSAYWAAASLPFLHLGETIYKPPREPAGISRSAPGVLSRSWALSRSEVGVRRENADRLLAALAGPSTHLVPIEPVDGAEPSYLRLPVLADPTALETLLGRSSRRIGVMPGYPRPLNRLDSCRARCVNASEEFPGATELAGRLVTLPTHGRLAEKDLRALEELISHL